MAFFESEVGIAFLHRLVVAAHFVITMLRPSGVRTVVQALENHFTSLESVAAMAQLPERCLKNIQKAK